MDLSAKNSTKTFRKKHRRTFSKCRARQRLYLTPKARAIKRKTDQLDFIKTKNFCSMKNHVKRMKRQAIV